MIPYGAVFRDRYDDEVVMVVGGRWTIYSDEAEWYHVIVIAGTPGVDYSTEQPNPLRKVVNEERWERIG